jgi:hypothetical protein
LKLFLLSGQQLVISKPRPQQLLLLARLLLARRHKEVNGQLGQHPCGWQR